MSINISSLYFTYNHFMKLFLTIILGLLLLQSVTGLHLHAEEEGSGNVTTTDNSTDIDNVT